MSNPDLARTPLTDWHAAHGGRMVDFAGWSMPVQYRSIVVEHQATRQALGLFDISHMGRLRFDGPQAGAFLNSLVTRDLARMQPGQVRYALMTNAAGGVLDDVLVTPLADVGAGGSWLLVVNAGNRAKILDWIAARLVDFRREHPQGVELTDLTEAWAMIAVQGPAAVGVLTPHVEHDLRGMGYYTATEARMFGRGGLVSRTGYTGEDGFELFVGAAAAVEIWERLIADAEPLGGMACGLGARDTLRLEAGMPLYGHELEENIDPYEAGLGFAVDLDKAAYAGQTELRRLKTVANRPRRVGLEVEGRRVARQGCDVLAGADIVGRVTSGTFSPTFDRSIAMAYVDSAHASVGAEIEVAIRDRPEKARVVKLPFYRRPQT